MPRCGKKAVATEKPSSAAQMVDWYNAAAVTVLASRTDWFPLVVIGMNSIAAYMIAHLFENFIEGTFKTHFGVGAFLAFGEAYEPFLLGACTLVAYWLILFWMYRRRLFLRI